MAYPPAFRYVFQDTPVPARAVKHSSLSFWGLSVRTKNVTFPGHFTAENCLKAGIIAIVFARKKGNSCLASMQREE